MQVPGDDHNKNDAGWALGGDDNNGKREEAERLLRQRVALSVDAVAKEEVGKWNASLNQRLRYSNGRQVELSKGTVLSIAELLLRHSSHVASDLKHFAKHAKRSTVTVDDVRLLARNNPSMLAALDSFLENEAPCGAGAPDVAARGGKKKKVRGKRSASEGGKKAKPKRSRRMVIDDDESILEVSSLESERDGDDTGAINFDEDDDLDFDVFA